MHQPRHHVGPLRQLEQLDLAVQPGVQAGQGLFRPPAKEPAHGRKQEMRGECDRRKAKDQHEQPERHRDGAKHRATLAAKTGAVNPAANVANQQCRSRPPDPFRASRNPLRFWKYSTGVRGVRGCEPPLLVGSVSIDMGDYNADPDSIFLEVFDAADVSLGYIDFLRPGPSHDMNTLSLTVAGISYAVFGTECRRPRLYRGRQSDLGHRASSSSRRWLAPSRGAWPAELWPASPRLRPTT